MAAVLHINVLNLLKGQWVYYMCTLEIPGWDAFLYLRWDLLLLPSVCCVILMHWCVLCVHSIV